MRGNWAQPIFSDGPKVIRVLSCYLFFIFFLSSMGEREGDVLSCSLIIHIKTHRQREMIYAIF